MDLNGKVALVTGAARRVGRAIALEFSHHSASVAVHYRSSQAEADAVVSEIAGMRGKAQAFRANLESVAEIEQMVAGVLDAFGRIDVLVNSASVFRADAACANHRARLGRESRHQPEGAVFSVEVCRCRDAPSGRGENRQPRRLGRPPPLQGLPALRGFEERADWTDAGAR